MKHLILIAFGLGLLSLGSCKKDEKEGSVNIHFKAIYDGQPLQMFTTLPFENGEQLLFSHLSMYISDLALTDQASSRMLDDIELIDLSFDNLVAAETGYNLKIMDVPEGTYDGIRFGVGVPADLNQKVPADFTSDNPLSKTGYYWVPWDSYIFMKMEGRLDTLGNGTLDLGFALHTGSDALYTLLEGQGISISVEDGKETNLTILIDYKIILEGIDIKASPQNHNPEDISTIQAVVDNLPAAFSLLQ